MPKGSFVNCLFPYKSFHRFEPRLLEISMGQFLGAGTAANTFIGRALVGAFVTAVPFAVFFDGLALFYFTSTSIALTRYFCHMVHLPSFFKSFTL
jgi:hypothetical protein